MGAGFRQSPLWGLKSATVAWFLGGFEKMEKGSAIENGIFFGISHELIWGNGLCIHRAS